jgi:hypothetical protein
VPPNQPPAQQPPGGYGVGGVPQEHPKGTTILVLGILSLVCCGLLGPVAWVMGNNARSEMAARPNVIWTNKGSVTAGWVCGIVGSVILILSILYFIVVFAIIGGST